MSKNNVINSELMDKSLVELSQTLNIRMPDLEQALMPLRFIAPDVPFFADFGKYKVRLTMDLGNRYKLTIGRGLDSTLHDNISIAGNPNNLALEVVSGLIRYVNSKQSSLNMSDVMTRYAS